MRTPFAFALLLSTILRNGWRKWVRRYSCSVLVDQQIKVESLAAVNDDMIEHNKHVVKKMLIDSRLFNILLCTKAGDENFKRTFARVRHYYAVSPLFLFHSPPK